MLVGVAADKRKSENEEETDWNANGDGGLRHRVQGASWCVVAGRIARIVGR